LSDRYRVIKDRSDFILEKITSDIISDEHYPIEEESKEITFPVRFNLRKEKTPVKIEKKKNILYADADKLKFPLIMRRWKAGDWFIPFGMNGKKKLSDYFTDRKFSLKDKKEAWVILSGENIVWIVNERSDNRYKITDESKNIFIIEYVDK
jgi:tRNA(Ile)-lysidine synthase